MSFVIRVCDGRKAAQVLLSGHPCIQYDLVLQVYYIDLGSHDLAMIASVEPVPQGLVVKCI